MREVECLSRLSVAFQFVQAEVSSQCNTMKHTSSLIYNYYIKSCIFLPSAPHPYPLLLQQVRQQSSTDLEEMKAGVEELKEQMAEADKAIAEIATSIAELEKKKSKVG